MVARKSYPEWKAANPEGIGQLDRLHVNVIWQTFIGKETNEIFDEAEDESGQVVTYPDA